MVEIGMVLLGIIIIYRLYMISKIVFTMYFGIGLFITFMYLYTGACIIENAQANGAVAIVIAVISTIVCGSQLRENSEIDRYLLDKDGIRSKRYNFSRWWALPTVLIFSLILLLVAIFGNDETYAGIALCIYSISCIVFSIAFNKFRLTFAIATMLVLIFISVDRAGSSGGDLGDYTTADAGIIPDTNSMDTGNLIPSTDNTPDMSSIITNASTVQTGAGLGAGALMASTLHAHDAVAATTVSQTNSVADPSFMMDQGANNAQATLDASTPTGMDQSVLAVAAIPDNSLTTSSVDSLMVIEDPSSGMMQESIHPINDTTTVVQDTLSRTVAATHTDIFGNMHITGADGMSVGEITSDGIIKGIDGLTDGHIIIQEDNSMVIQDSQNMTIARITANNVVVDTDGMPLAIMKKA